MVPVIESLSGKKNMNEEVSTLDFIVILIILLLLMFNVYRDKNICIPYATDSEIYVGILINLPFQG